MQSHFWMIDMSQGRFMMDMNNANIVDLGCEPGGLSCKLTTTALQQRKATVIAGLKEQLIERKELANGYAFCFNNSDKILDRLIEFIKTEKACRDFFTFRLSVDKTEAWLELTGPDGAKNFIVTEMEL